MYRVVWEDKAIDDLSDLPDKISTQIYNKVEKYLALEPRNLGAPLSGNYSGYYRYRMGDYRIIYEINDDEIVIYVVRVGHRKEIYE